VQYCNDCFAVFESEVSLCPMCKSADLARAEADSNLEPAAGRAEPGQTYWELNGGRREAH
jgi:hypothetical protein